MRLCRRLQRLDGLFIGPNGELHLWLVGILGPASICGVFDLPCDTVCLPLDHHLRQTRHFCHVWSCSQKAHQVADGIEYSADGCQAKDTHEPKKCLPLIPTASLALRADRSEVDTRHPPPHDQQLGSSPFCEPHMSHTGANTRSLPGTHNASSTIQGTFALLLLSLTFPPPGKSH